LRRQGCLPYHRGLAASISVHAKFLELTGTPEPGPVPSLANTADPIWVRDRYRTRIQSRPEDRPSRFQEFMSLALILLGSQGEVVGQDNRSIIHTNRFTAFTLLRDGRLTVAPDSLQPQHMQFLATGNSMAAEADQFMGVEVCCLAPVILGAHAPAPHPTLPGYTRRSAKWETTLSCHKR
jgi:hypothetical protein